MRVATWILLSIAVAACERAGDGRKQVVVPAPRLSMTLLDEGAGPRAPLRYHFAPAAQNVEYTEEAIDHIGGQTTHHPIAYARYESRVVEVDARGRYHQLGRYLDVGHRARPGDVPLSPTEQRHESLRGATIESWDDPRGGYREGFTISADPGAPVEDLLGAAGEGMIVFPDQAVGPGAHWRFATDDGKHRATVDVELLSVHGDAIELRTAFDVVYAYPGMTMDGHGTADWHVDLGGPRSTMHLQMHATVDGRPDVGRDINVDLVPVDK